MPTYTYTDVEANSVFGPGGGVHGSGANDTFNLTATNSLSQLHGFGQWGNDTFNLKFSGITGFAHGHHIYADLVAKPTYSDTFNFQNLEQVQSGGIVVGRLNGFDASPNRDVIKIEGQILDLNNLSSFSHINVSSIRIVSFNGAHNDLNTQPQQWLLIETSSGGHIFYALEGVRIDMTGNGGSNNGSQELHFIGENDLPDFASLPDVDFTSTQNFVPAGYLPQGGIILNDRDQNPNDVLAQIQGSSNGDLIAAGLNDDIVEAGAGNDIIWGGTGHDTIFGEHDNDEIYGNHGNDLLNGGIGNDTAIGGLGNDELYGQGGFDWLEGGGGNDHIDGGNQADNLLGGSGDDTLLGGNGLDRLFGEGDDDFLSGWQGNDALFGQNGNDTLVGQQDNDRLDGGSGNDWLDGGTEEDFLSGGAGFDTLIASSGNDTLRGDFNADTFVFYDSGGGFGQDIILDFDANNNFERVDLSRVASINNFSDLMSNHISQVGSNVLIDAGGNNTITLVNVTINDLDNVDFIF
ncbi:MAG: calcium-binding protein [Gammaproteobacteria bacterium]